MKVGDKFGRWTVLALIPHAKNPSAECMCECGNLGRPQRGAMRSGKSHSCGCLRREKLLAAAKTHGICNAPEYSVWKNIIDRCNNPNNKHFSNYGGRGISVEWGSFEDFYADMGERPDGMLIERIDSNGSYSKDNCTWAGWKDQSINKRTSRVWVVYGTEYKSSVDAAMAFNVDPSTINAWCRGRKSNGKVYHPKPGCSSRFKYEGGMSKKTSTKK